MTRRRTNTIMVGRRPRAHIYVESLTTPQVCSICQLPERNSVHASIDVWDVSLAATGELTTRT